MEVFLEPVSPSTINLYIQVGKKSYYEHYLHLWEDRNPNAYISKSFTVSVVQAELKNPNIANFLVKVNNESIGIVKLVRNKALDEYSDGESLLVEKIYLLKSYSGKGFGRKVLHLIENYARNLNKKIVWLDTMQKGGPLNFYLKNGFAIKKEGALNLPGAKSTERAMWVLTKHL